MKLKNILFIAIAILTIGLFVACNDDVVVAAKDNNVAYTQVLESNGAFEYNGTKYETLQDAIEAIDKAKAYPSKTIKVLKDVNSDGATVPATAEYIILLDLNGKTLSFLSANGITVDGGLYVTGDGEFAFSEGVTDGTAITVSGTGAFYVEDAKFNVPGQNAVKATGGTVYLRDNTEITGNIEASGTSTVNLRDNSKFTEKGTVTIGTGATVSVSTTNKPTMVLNLEGGTLEVSSKVALDEDSSLDSGVIVLPSVATDNYIEKPESLDISQITMSTGLFSISRTTGMTYYKSLQDAIVEYESSDLVITQIFADTTAASIGVEKCVSGVTTVKINTKNNGDTSDIGALTVSAGYTLEVTGNGTVTSVNLGSTTGDTPTYGTLVVTGTDTVKPVISEVTGTGVVESSNVVFFGSVECTTLTDGANGSGSTFKGAITAKKGLISLSGSILDTSIIDESNEKFVYTDAADNGDIASITLSGVTFNYTDNKYAGVFSAEGGSISISNSIGKAFKIIATNTGSNLPKTVTINNSNLTSGSLTVVDEVASRVGDSYYGNVSITGRSTDSSAVNVDKIDAAAITISHATVTNTNQGQSGARARSGNFISDNCVFNSVVEVFGSGNNLTDGDKTTEKKGSTFTNGISVYNGSASFYSSTFNPSVNETQYTSFSADSVTIKKSVFSTRTDVGHEGETTNILYNITADKTVSSLSSNTNEINLTIEESTGYVGSLNTTGNTTVSTYSYSSDILVDNSSISSGTLSVGSLSSTDNNNTHAYFGDVTVKGNSPTTGDDPKSRAVTVGSIPYAADVKTSYAVVSGAIGSTDTPVASVADGWTDTTPDPDVTYPGKSVFNGNIYASGAGIFNNSTFDTKNVSDKSVSGSTLSFTSSTFVKDDGTASPTAYTKLYALTASGADPDANTSALKITTSTGSVASLTAKAGSITVDNNASNANLTVTGAVSAYDNVSTYYDVTLTGPTTTGVALQVGAITGKKVDSTRATVTDTVVAKANVVSKLSLFQSTVTAVTTVADGTSASDLGNSEFQGNISANGAITLYGSKFSGTTAPTINSEHAGNIGLYNCTGSVGNILSKGYNDSSVVTGLITIDNSKAKANLNAMSVQSYYDYNTDGDYDSDIDTAGTVEIVAPDYDSTLTTQPMLYFGNTSHNLYRITGSVTLKDGSDYTAGTLVLYGGSGHEIEGNNLTIYGGQYGDAGDSFCFTSTGTIKIHGGTCYINEVEMLQAVLEKVVGDYNSLEVDIILGDTTFMLTRSVTIGGQSPYLTGKNIYIHGGTSTSPKTIMVPYYNSTNYRSYAINLASGNLIYSGVVIEPVSLSSEITEGYYTCPDSKIACTLAYDDPNGVPSGINGSFCGGYVCKY